MSNVKRTDEWQWHTPVDGKIAGLTPRGWVGLGISRWGTRRNGGVPQICIYKSKFVAFQDEREYAPLDDQYMPMELPVVAVPVEIAARDLSMAVLCVHLANGGRWAALTPAGTKVVDNVHDILVISGHVDAMWSPCDEHGKFCELRTATTQTSSWRFRPVEKKSAVWNSQLHTIDGLTIKQWVAAGVEAWAKQYTDGSVMVDTTSEIVHFDPDYRYAPARSLPVAAPANWPQVEIGSNLRPVAETKEIVEVKGRDMTKVMFYGHLVMGGTWRYRFMDEHEYAEATDYSFDSVCPDETWSPCDERGEPCALRAPAGLSSPAARLINPL